MARFSVNHPEVQELVRECIVPLYLETGSVASVAKLLADAADGQGASIHPNRLHAVLSDEPGRALNEQSMKALRTAAAHHVRGGAAKSADQARLSELGSRVLSVSGGAPIDIALLAERMSLPHAVVRLALEAVGERQAEIAAAPSNPSSGPDWSFQDTAVAHCLDAFRRRPNGNIGLVLPTGAGKTRTALRIILDVLAKTSSTTSQALWITHRKSLRTQADRELKKLLRANPGSLPPNAADLAQRIRFLMLGEANAAIAASTEPPALVVIDEAHHAAAPTYQPIFEAGHAYPALLLTATPNRPDLLPIGIDEIAFTITYRELADRGCIITPHFEAFEVPDFSLSAESMDDLVDRLLDDCGSRFRKTLVLVTRVDQMRELHERLSAAIDRQPSYPLRSSDVGFIDGSGNSHGLDNEDFLALFAAKDRSVLISAQMLLEGYDDPQIDSVVITYRTESVIKLMQAAGRCVRYAPGKTEAWVVQADNPALAYRFDQRWLYQEIDDALLPELQDIDFRDSGEMLSIGADLLTSHRVEARSRSEAMAAMAKCTPEHPPRLMFYGLPYFGSAEQFEQEARWGVFVETAENSAVFRAVFNRFSQMGAERSDPSEFLDVIGPTLGLQLDDQRLRRQLMGVLTAAYFAHEELSGTRGPAQGNRGYVHNHSTTWLRYVTMRHRPLLPDALSAFLSDCHNRGSIEQAYSATPDEFALAIKTSLPFGGSEAVLLKHDEASALEQWLRSVREALKLIEPSDQLAQLASITARLAPPPLPMTHIARAERLLSDEGRAQFTLDLTNEGDLNRDQ
jgi:superfamily II DNA or RNA helicase